MKLNKPTQKAKLSVSTKNLGQEEINDFTGVEFQKLKQKNLRIPVKLFHL